MNLAVVSKTVFLGFIIALAVYIMYTNKAEEKQVPATPKQEHFSDPAPMPLSARIKDVYKKLYGSAPNDQELTFYIHFFKGKDANMAYMKDIISTSAPTLQKVLKTGAMPTLTTGQGTEQDVIAVYKQLLDRNPNPVELEFYSSYIKQGPAYLEKMKVQLIGSPEYRSHQKLQDNNANSGYLEGITDRQLEFMITKVYKEVTSQGDDIDDIDDDTMTFLKKKFLEFEADDAVFRTFVKDFVAFKPKSPKTPTAPTATQPLSTPSTPSTPSTTTPIIEKYTSSCPSRNAKPKVSEASQASMARFINQRNRDELRNICERNSAYAKYHDEDMVITPGYELKVCTPTPNDPSLMGTLLSYTDKA